MGCGSSSASSPASGSYPDDDEDFRAETNRQKAGGKSKNAKGGVKEDCEDDMFEVEEATGEQFMSVRPWIGQIAEPASHNDVCNDKPDETYALEYVYGYRSADSRQNVHYNSNGNAVYMTAALGVILD